MKVEREIVIIGAGPAGLTAAIYSARELMDTLVLESGMSGGLPLNTHKIENYPGFPGGISGAELMDKLKEQALSFGAEIKEYDEVIGIERNPESIDIITKSNSYSAKSVIIATGSVPKKLNIPGENKFMGRGVSYCATCDGPFFRNMDVAVIGCGNSGLQEGQTLTDICNKVVFIEYLPDIPGEKIIYERLRDKDNTEFMIGCQIMSVNGDQVVESITVKNRETNEEKDVPVSGVFFYVGYEPNSAFLSNIVDKTPEGYVLANDKMETKTDGLYVAGDVRAKDVLQITTACSDGTIAAINARKYVKSLDY